MVATLASTLGFIALTAAPAALLVLALSLLLAPEMPERRVHQIVATGLSVGLACTLAVAVLQPLLGVPLSVDLGQVLAVRGYHLDLGFVLDGPALTLLALDLALCGLVGLFSARYLHQEAGFRRFYVLLMLLAVGVSVIATARGLDLLFAGWELVGLSSALLIAFFHQRPDPVAHGLRAYAVYRTTDVGLLLGLVLLHHLAGSAELARLGELPLGPESWLIAGLLVFGAMGKGASVPFTGWLPRAMEGPTPSSAIFYGALSIHASPFLLLRIQPLLDSHVALRVAVVVIGLVTALHASMVGRVQADIKTSLGYASVAQVGLIWIWAGLGWEHLALAHIAGHASLRTWQLLRAPNLLHDRHHLSTLLGGEPGRAGLHLERLLPRSLERRLYAVSLERWFLDELLDGVLRAVFGPLRALDRLDQRWGETLDTPTPPALGAPKEVTR
ncbi:MAG: hypothetical protein H6739_32225 [Alphaproteobacteria bacterium]|nr:hypothetical protein [Alphaproteobacteria bacterium]